MQRSKRAALVPQVLGRRPARALKIEQEPGRRDAAFAQVTARFGKGDKAAAPAVDGLGVAGSNPVSQTFRTTSELRKRNSEAVLERRLLGVR